MLSDITNPKRINKAVQISPTYVCADAGHQLLDLHLHGDAGSEFGEKQNLRRLELLARFYF